MTKHTGKPLAGEVFPALTMTLMDDSQVTVGPLQGEWQLLVVYRGKHCGRCKKYLNILESMKSEWEAAGFTILAVSADTKARAQSDIDEFGWSFPVAYGLTEQDMRTLGVYISDPLSADEAPARFSEPAVFCLRPDASVQIAAISNGPSARPDLAELLDGMIFTIDNAKPARGTVV